MARFKPGVSFSDFVVQDFSATKSRAKSDSGTDYRRVWFVWLMTVIAFGTLFSRLAVLQLFRGGTYEALADENRIQTIRLPAKRGSILDRNDRELARSIAVTTKDIHQRDVPNWQREYPYGLALGHVTGYLAEVREEEVGLLKNAGKKYEPGDRLGRMGLEQVTEEKLRGVDGGNLVEVDSAGQVVRSLGQRNPVDGENVKTTLDGELANVGYKAIMNGKIKKGAVIAANPQTGEILALVSAPGFDPMDIGPALTDKNLPLFNRAIGGVYPPGSTFKMNTTIAAIESGKVAPDFVFTDAGIITVGDFKYTNWLFTKHGGVEGVVGFSRSITRSTDTFFYKVGEMTGPEIIGQWAEKMGMGVKTGIDLPGEVTGIVGTPETRKKLTKGRWFLGDTYHMAIGQADTLLTPLQVNVMTNVLASEGEYCKPHILAGQPDCHHVSIGNKALAIVKDGMIGACSSGGTAFPLFDWNDAAKAKGSSAQYTKSEDILPVIACKTGTAEYVSETGAMRTHAWLTAYAPADNPRISVTVLVEGGGEGSNAAAPIVRQVLAKYFNVTDTYPYANIPQETGE